MDAYLTVPCPACGRNVVFPPERRTEVTKCRGCNFEFIPSLPASITSTYTPVPMGPEAGPPEKRESVDAATPHQMFLFGCPIEMWLVLIALAAHSAICFENAIARILDPEFADPEGLMTRFYGPTLAAYSNLLGILGALDLILAYFMYHRSDNAYYIFLARGAFGTLLAAAMLSVGDHAPIGFVFPIMIMIASLSRAGGRY